MPSGRTEQLKQHIEAEIIRGSLKPGDRLDEMSLASRFGVSRTPIREALLQLSSMGLVEMRPRRGAVVASIGLRDLLDMFEVMAELEGMCGRLAARRASDEECARLQQVHDASRDAVDRGDYDAYYECNVQFHDTLYKAGRNPYLADQTTALRNRLAPYRRSQLHQNNRLQESFREHEAILDAIRRKAPDEAESLIKSHLTAQGGTLRDFIACLPPDMLNDGAMDNAVRAAE